MGNDVLMSLVASECRQAVKACDGNLQAKLRAAMMAAKDHWMVTDREMQFKGAVAAVMAHYGKNSPECARIEAELMKIRQFNAFFAAAEAGLSPTLPENVGEQPEPIGIMKMWREVTRAKSLTSKE